MRTLAFLLATVLVPAVSAQDPSPPPTFDVLIKGGTVYDGTGGEGAT